MTKVNTITCLLLVDSIWQIDYWKYLMYYTILLYYENYHYLIIFNNILHLLCISSNVHVIYLFIYNLTYIFHFLHYHLYWIRIFIHLFQILLYHLALNLHILHCLYFYVKHSNNVLCAPYLFSISQYYIMKNVLKKNLSQYPYLEVVDHLSFYYNLLCLSIFDFLVGLLSKTTTDLCNTYCLKSKIFSIILIVNKKLIKFSTIVISRMKNSQKLCISTY